MKEIEVQDESEDKFSRKEFMVFEPRTIVYLEKAEALACKMLPLPYFVLKLG